MALQLLTVANLLFRFQLLLYCLLILIFWVLNGRITECREAANAQTQIKLQIANETKWNDSFRRQQKQKCIQRVSCRPYLTRLSQIVLSVLTFFLFSIHVHSIDCVQLNDNFRTTRLKNNSPLSKICSNVTYFVHRTLHARLVSLSLTPTHTHSFNNTHSQTHTLIYLHRLRRKNENKSYMFNSTKPIYSFSIPIGSQTFPFLNWKTILKVI